MTHAQETTLLQQLENYLEGEQFHLSPARHCRIRCLLDGVRAALAERETCANQTETNTRWLIGMIDRIHTALCPGKSGTWQRRAEQAVKTAEQESGKKREAVTGRKAMGFEPQGKEGGDERLQADSGGLH